MFKLQQCLPESRHTSQLHKTNHTQLRVARVAVPCVRMRGVLPSGPDAGAYLIPLRHRRRRAELRDCVVSEAAAERDRRPAAALEGGGRRRVSGRHQQAGQAYKSRGRFIHSINRPFIHSSIHPSIHSLIHSFIHSLIHSLIH